MDPKKFFRTVNKVEDLAFKLACGVNLLSALHEAIEYGKTDAESYKDGLFGAYEYISDIQEQIQAVVDGCYEHPASQS